MRQSGVANGRSIEIQLLYLGEPPDFDKHSIACNREERDTSDVTEVIDAETIHAGTQGFPAGIPFPSLHSQSYEKLLPPALVIAATASR